MFFFEALIPCILIVDVFVLLDYWTSSYNKSWSTIIDFDWLPN